MKINETKRLQNQKLQEICEKQDVDYKSIDFLLDAVKNKKLHNKNNNLFDTIDKLIENTQNENIEN